MKFIIFFLLLSSVCFSQKNNVPVLTKLDTLKIQSYNDSVNVKQVMDDFKNSVFKKLQTGDQYDYLKDLIDQYMATRRKQ